MQSTPPPHRKVLLSPREPKQPESVSSWFLQVFSSTRTPVEPSLMSTHSFPLGLMAFCLMTMSLHPSGASSHCWLLFLMDK